MKKMTVFLMSAVLAFGLAACGSDSKPASAKPAGSTASTEQTGSTASASTGQSGSAASSTEQTGGTASASTEQSGGTAAAPAESGADTQPQTGKKLVVYYSASGNTERVAKDIAEAAGADLFEIVPTEVYTSDDLNWTKSDSRVSKEHDDEALRDVPLTTTEVPDWDSYDTVFIGYPIWWGIAAWPVDGFVKANDFTGKTVIPFATSSSSGMGESGSLLAEMAGTGDCQDGQRFSSGVSAADVQTWVDGLE